MEISADVIDNKVYVLGSWLFNIITLSLVLYIIILLSLNVVGYCNYWFIGEFMLGFSRI